MKKNLCRLLIAAAVGLSPCSLLAATISVEKRCDNQTLVQTGAYQFSISQAQWVSWDADIKAVSNDPDPANTHCNGAGFYLEGMLATGLAVEVELVKLPANNSKLPPRHLHNLIRLEAGSYDINPLDYRNGLGTYTIGYNLTASIAIEPAVFDFGQQLTGVTDSQSFTVNSTGELPASVQNPVSSDPHFQISSITSPGPADPPNVLKRFVVNLVTGQIPGPVVATITAAGTSPNAATVQSAVAQVSGEVMARYPHIVFTDDPTGDGTVFLGRANPQTHEPIVGFLRYQNTGTANLVHMKDIELVNDTVPNVFAFDSLPSTAVLAAGDTRTIAIRFTPPANAPLTADETVFQGHVIVYTNDPDTPVKQCQFSAASQVPPPVLVLLPPRILDFGNVPVGFGRTRTIFVNNAGNLPLTTSLQLSHQTETDLPQWSNIPLNQAKTVAPDGPGVAFPVEYRPQAVGIHALWLKVASNDPGHRNAPFFFSGRGTSAPPAQSAVLLLDQSAAAAETAGIDPSRTSSIIRTAERYVNFLRVGTDSLGLVKLSTSVIDTVPFQPLTAAQKTAIVGRLQFTPVTPGNSVRPVGNTTVLAALDHAIGILKANATDHRGTIMLVMDLPAPAGPRPNLTGSPVPLPLPAGQLLNRLVARGAAEGIEVYIVLCTKSSDEPRGVHTSHIYFLHGNQNGVALEALDNFLFTTLPAP